MMIDLLCGILPGAKSGPNVRKWTNHDEPANVGQFFVALDPDCFAPGMSERLQVNNFDTEQGISILCTKSILAGFDGPFEKGGSG